MNKSTNTMAKVLFLLLLAVAGTAKAQDYSQKTREYHPLIPKSGERQWDVRSVLIWGETQYQVMRLGEEIELDGVLYREMTYEVDGNNYYSTGLEGAIREEDKKVYVRWWEEGLQSFMEEKLYYDFSLQVGDSFEVCSYGEPCFIQVVAIEEMEMEDGTVRNAIVFNEGWEGEEVWIEGVGSLAGIHRRFDPSLTSSSFPYLQCYFEDDDLVWTDGECWDDVEETAAEQVSVYPNPAKDFVKIEGVDAAEVQVYNGLGQVVKRVKGMNEVCMEGIPQGIYMLCITDTEGKKHVARVMVKE